MEFMDDLYVSSSEEDEEMPFTEKHPDNGPTTALTTTAETGSVSKTGEDAGEDEYEVERIVNHRIRKTRQGQSIIEFFIKWKGWPGSANTWEKRANLVSCKEMLREYEQQHASPDMINNSVTQSTKKRTKPPVSNDGDDEESNPSDHWEVEALVDRRVRKSQTKVAGSVVEYKIKWKGWPTSSNSWEPESSLHCHELLTAYIAKHGPVVPVSAAKKLLKRMPDRFPTPAFKLRQTKSAVKRISRDSSSSRQEVPLPILPTPDRVRPIRVADRRRFSSVLTETSASSGSEDYKRIVMDRSLSKSSANSLSPIKLRRNEVPSEGSFVASLAADDDISDHRASRCDGSKSIPLARRCTLKIQEGYPCDYKDRTLPAKNVPGIRSPSDAEDSSTKQQTGEKGKLGTELEPFVRVFVMDDAEIIRVKQFTIGPGEVDNWVTLQYSQKDLVFPDEPIKILGQCKSRNNHEDFYLCIQGVAPDLYFGLSEVFLKRRYPKSLRLLMRYSTSDTSSGSSSVERENKKRYLERDLDSDQYE